MSWYQQAGDVLHRHYEDPQATMVGLYVLNKMQVLIRSVTGKSVSDEIGRMFMDEMVHLPTNTFWANHGAMIVADISNRYWDFSRSAGVLAQQGQDINAQNFAEMVRGLGQRRSYLSTCDLILRLHVPLSDYLKKTELLNRELSAIGDL